MAKLLITGGAGFIGTNIALKAKERKYDVFIFDSLIRPLTEENLPVLKDAGVTIFRGDIRNDQDFQRFEEANGKPDAIIHLAGNPGIPWSIAHPKYDFEVNALGTINVLERARAWSTPSHKIPVIFASTNKVYSDLINTIPLKKGAVTRYEWDHPREGWIDGVSHAGVNEGFSLDGFGQYPRSPYGVSKTAGDLYMQEYFHTYGVPVVVNRMSCIYGNYQKGVEDQGWVDWFVRCIAFGDGKINIYGDGKQVRDMLWGEDVADLYLEEIEKIEQVKGSVFNVGGGKKNTLSLLEAISYIEELTGKKAIITNHPWRHADQKIYISDISKVCEAVGWIPRINPQEGIRRIYEKYKRS